jgi:hypothetical protein
MLIPCRLFRGIGRISWKNGGFFHEMNRLMKVHRLHRGHAWSSGAAGQIRMHPTATTMLSFDSSE